MGDGAAIYKAACAGCHGDTGLGDGPAGLAFRAANPPVVVGNLPASELDVTGLRDIITGGGAKVGKNPIMPANPSIVGADLDALVAYVKDLQK